MAPVRAVAATLVRPSPRPRTALRAAFATCCCRFASSSSSSSSPLPPPKEVAVLGAGLTGLATAHYLATRLPATTRITVYESSTRVGGWIDSSPVFLGDSNAEDNVFEAGARTVAPQRNTGRYDDLLLLELVAQLGLADRLRVTRRRPAQYIYYPDHLVEVSTSGDGSGSATGGLYSALVALVALVSPRLAARLEQLGRMGRLVGRVLSEPLFKGLVPVLLRLVLLPEPEARRQAQMRSMVEAARSPGRLPPDESAGAYAVRRMGPAAADEPGRAEAEAVVNNLLSAVVHGIYGGDVWRLSVGSSPLRGDWLRHTLTPLFERYVLRAQYATLRQQMMGEGLTEAGAGAAVEEDSEARRFADTDPKAPLERQLPADLMALARVFGGGDRCAFVQASDLALLEDLTVRTQLQEETTAVTTDLTVRLAFSSRQWTTFGFAGGFGTLTDALARRLQQRPNVRFCTGEAVTAVTAKTEQLEVHTATSAEPYDRVVSTLAAPTLFRVTGGSGGSGGGGGGNKDADGAVPALRDAHAVTIMVVNLYYAEPHLNAPYHGFGYLIPQSVPLAENPEAALGVLFDSDREALLEEWELRDGEAVPITPTPGTKFSILFGGHFWDDYADPDDFPTPDEAVAMAEAVVRRHLRTLPAGLRPVATRTKLCRQCIPQHYVGHAARMAAADAQLAHAFGGRLAVAGGSFTATGPGVLASVRSAYDVALRVAGRGYRRMADPAGVAGETAMDHVGDTGLARFSRPETDAVVPVVRRRLPLRFGNATYRDAATGSWAVPRK